MQLHQRGMPENIQASAEGGEKTSRPRLEASGHTTAPVNPARWGLSGSRHKQGLPHAEVSKRPKSKSTIASKSALRSVKSVSRRKQAIRCDFCHGDWAACRKTAKPGQQCLQQDGGFAGQAGYVFFQHLHSCWMHSRQQNNHAASGGRRSGKHTGQRSKICRPQTCVG